MRVVTFNIRYGSAPDGANAWPLRRAFFVDSVRRLDPDLLGMQEPDPDQWREVAADLGPGWTGLHGATLDPAHPDAHGKAVVWRTDRFDRLEHGRFWISETPDEPESILQPNQWGQRTGAWVRLRDRRNGRPLVFLVTHFDTHPGCALRSAEIFAAQAARAAAGDPVIAVGDFNVPANTPAWASLTGPGGFRDAWREAGLDDDGVITFNDFDPNPRLPAASPERRAYLERKYHGDRFEREYVERGVAAGNERIDWILLRGGWRATAAGADTAVRDGRTASDHFAVHADVEWGPA